MNENNQSTVTFPSEIKAILTNSTESEDSIRYIKYDIALKLFMNSDLVNTTKSIEEVAKIAVRNAETFYKVAKKANLL